jgi:hypothetical protein
VHPITEKTPRDWRGQLGQILVAVDTDDGWRLTLLRYPGRTHPRKLPELLLPAGSLAVHRDQAG